jgi:hypothetical protein
MGGRFFMPAPPASHLPWCDDLLQNDITHAYVEPPAILFPYPNNADISRGGSDDDSEYSKVFPRYFSGNHHNGHISKMKNSNPIIWELGFFMPDPSGRPRTVAHGSATKPLLLVLLYRKSIMFHNWSHCSMISITITVGTSGYWNDVCPSPASVPSIQPCPW